MEKKKKHIHIVSPAGVVCRDYVDGAVRVLQGMGYEVTVAPHVYDHCGRFAGTVEERLADINAALSDRTIDILLCSRGGYGMAQLVDKIVIPTGHCPLVVGFSDVTCFHNLLGSRDIASLHGLMTKHISGLPLDDRSMIAFCDILEGKGIDYRLPPHRLNRSGSTEGVLRGGNLSVLYGLQGTPYALRRGGILFIEDIGERQYHIDRMLQNLRLSGVLSELSGLVVGQFTDCEEDPTMCSTVQETIRDMVEEYDYPVVFDFPAGHTDRNLPLLLNHRCRLEVGRDEVWLVQKGVNV